MPVEPESESPGDGYQRWLDDLAGEPVPVGWMIVWWLVLGIAVFGSFAVIGVESDAPAGVTVGLISLAYWFWAVPKWARRRGEGNNSQKR